ncbi:MAG: hypothetical protein CVU48_10715 [Candidatus Cloacimonetes bacterium HGW-Cloacimonetes-1]|jgi:SAM-dependent methyltransferase|nr:MAG: hypothetical protein CVU48_10715 [Candidatus Cloacimonetes bacterium HGW-Cloacimonetes-1]
MISRQKNSTLAFVFVTANAKEAYGICNALQFYPHREQNRYIVFTESVIPEFQDWHVADLSKTHDKPVSLFTINLASVSKWLEQNPGFVDALIYTSESAYQASNSKSNETPFRLYRSSSSSVLFPGAYLKTEKSIPNWLALEGSQLAYIDHDIENQAVAEGSITYNNIGLYFRKARFSEILLTDSEDVAQLMYEQNPLDCTVVILDSKVPAINLMLDSIAVDNIYYRIYREISAFESTIFQTSHVPHPILELFTRKELSKNSSYSLFAQYYDVYMAHVDYSSWIALLMECFSLYSTNNLDKILELACGTATISSRLVREGYIVDAADSSGHMLSIASMKSNKPRLFAHFMGSPLPVSDYDLVLCLFDSVNYLLKPEYISALLNSVYDALNSGGLFIFDISTIQNSLENFSDSTYLTQLKDGYLVHRAEYDEETYLQKSYLTFFKMIGNSYKLFEESHEQMVYRNREIIDLISATSFQLVAIHCLDSKVNLLSRKNPNIDKNNPRLFYVLRKD